jgi:hypothetical protein
MSHLEPPRVADWLVTRLLPTTRVEILLGDLHEQYRRGRSHSWYWRQAIEICAFSLARDLRSHKLLTLRALALGWAMLVSGDLFVLRPLWRFDHWLFMAGLVSHYVAFSGPVSTALLVALLGAGCGWTVGRTHRACAVPIAFAFALSVEAYVTMALAWWLYAVFPHLTVVYWQGVVVRLSLTTILAPLSILTGGLLADQTESKRLPGEV